MDDKSNKILDEPQTSQLDIEKWTCEYCNGTGLDGDYEDDILTEYECVYCDSTGVRDVRK